MTKDVFLYALVDPMEDRIRYIGRTINPLDVRLRDHISAEKRGKIKDGKKAKWIKSLLAAGVTPKIVLLATATKDTFKSLEKSLVMQYRLLYEDLLNVNSGGDGSLGGYKANWTKEIDAKLGTISDSAIALQVGVTRKAVSYRRKQLGIKASFDKTNSVPPPKMGGHNKTHFTDQLVGLLGLMPDYKIAEMAGCTKKAVARKRKELGIKSYAEQTGNNGQIKKGDPHLRWKQ